MTAPDIPEPPPGSVVLLHRWYDPEWGVDTWITLAEGVHTVALAQQYAEHRFAETVLGRDSLLMWRRHNGDHVAGYLPGGAEPLYMVVPAGSAPPAAGGFGPAAAPTCTGCGRPIHRVHGMWIDDLGRGHCPAGAKQGHNSHTPTAPVPSRTCVGCGHSITFAQAAGVWIDELKRVRCAELIGGHRPSIATEPLAADRYVLHATSVMTAIRDGRLILSLAGPAGSVDVELHHADVTALAEDLEQRLTGGDPAAGPVPPVQAVYVVEKQVSPHRWQQFDVEVVYPSLARGQEIADNYVGYPLSWSEDKDSFDRPMAYGFATGEDAKYRVRPLTLAGTQGGVR